MADTMLTTGNDDFSPRRSHALPLSPLLLIDALSRKSVSYDKLPEEPLKLSVLKLDSSSFDVQVTKTATVAELKEAVEAVFSHLPQKGPGKILWPHIWGHFCLCYNGQKLVIDTDNVRDFGIKDGDQLHFIRHVSISYNLIKKRSKKGIVASKQKYTLRPPSISCDKEEEKENNKEYNNRHEREKRKIHHYTDQGCFIGQHETRLSRLLGEWFSQLRITTSGKGRTESLTCPSTSRISTGFMGGCKKIIQRCGWKCYPTRKPTTLLLCCERRYPPILRDI